MFTIEHNAGVPNRRLGVVWASGRLRFQQRLPVTMGNDPAALAYLPPEKSTWRPPNSLALQIEIHRYFMDKKCSMIIF